MKRTIGFVSAVVAALTLSAAALAIYGVIDKGVWPKSWPEPLEPLRKQARTLEGPMAPYRHYAIRFTNHEQFMAAWPHILKVKTKGAPVFLLRGENFFLGEHRKSGVVIHCPPVSQPRKSAAPETPIPGVTNPRLRWMNTTFVDLVVDEDIVTFDSKSLPPDTPVIDERKAGEK